MAMFKALCGASRGECDVKERGVGYGTLCLSLLSQRRRGISIEWKRRRGRLSRYPQARRSRGRFFEMHDKINDRTAEYFKQSVRELLQKR
jgi:hypothetical protein